MARPQPDIPIVNSAPDSIPGTRSFSHEAMATTFEIIILYENARYAEQAAWAAFDELDRLEAELSRFIENSDISRINNLAAGQSLRVGPAAFECLQLCAQIYTETNGAFDITIGSLKSGVRSQKSDSVLCPIGMHLIKLDEAQHTVQLLSEGVQIDLGGIGKGYAVDRMAELLGDWDIDTAVIHGGFSSVLALGSPRGAEGWPLILSDPSNRKQTLARLCLRGRAVGGSGLEKGRHIIDPRTARPVEGKCAAWAFAPDAATADALSTAFMVMTPDEVNHYCLRHLDVLAMVILKSEGEEVQKDRILRYGLWKEDALLK